MTERSSFKIFVGVFPPKNIASVGNSITIYQTSVMEYYPATILDNPQIINESYDQNDCENTILGCDENFIVPPPPDNCGGGGTQGPPGPPGPQGPPGPAGTGGGGRIYCGTLSGPVAPPADNGVKLSCLLSERGYVVNIGSTSGSCGFSVNDDIFNCDFYYRVNTGQGGPGYGYYDFSGGMVSGGTSNQCQGTYGRPQLETLFRKTGQNTYAQEWTFEQFLLMQYGANGGQIPQDLASQPRDQIVNRAKGSGQTGYIFVPTGSTWRSGSNSSFGDWLDILGGNTESETAQNLLDQNPSCGPGQAETPPPVTNAGGSICGGGSPPTNTSSSCGECPPNSGISNCADVKAGDVFIDATNGVMYFATSAGGFADNGIPLAGNAACDTTGCEECNECIDGCGGGGGGGGGGTSCPECPSVCPEGQECAQVGCPGQDGVSDQNGDPCPCSVDIGEGGAQPGVYTCCPENWNCQPPAQPCSSGNFPIDPCCECAIEVNGQTSYVNKVCPCPEGQECRAPCPACPACNSCCSTQTYSSTGLTGGL